MTDARDEKRQVLDELGVYVSTPVGQSMRPMLRGERDNILIEKYEGRLRRLDVCLYARADGKHVLHRVIRVRENDYVIRGDNCDYTERGITDADIIGRLTGFWRGDRFISCDKNRLYRLYSHIWPRLYPLHVLRIRLVRRLAKSRVLRAIWHRIRGR